MGVFDKIGSKWWKQSAEQIEKEAPEKLGTFLYKSPVQATRIYTIGELLKFIYDPVNPIEYRVIACHLFLSENISFMEPKMDENTQISIQELLGLIGDTWQPEVDALSFLESEAKESNSPVMKKEVTAFRWMMTMWADEHIIHRFNVLVYNKGFNKEDHVPNTIVVGHSVPQMQMPGQMQTGYNIIPTGNIEGPIKPSDDPLPAKMKRGS